MARPNMTLKMDADTSMSASLTLNCFEEPFQYSLEVGITVEVKG